MSLIFFYSSTSSESLAAKELVTRIDNDKVRSFDVSSDQGKLLIAQYSISHVPTLLVLSAQGQEIKRIIGYNPKEFLLTLSTVNSDLEERLCSLINSSKLMLFIKGTPLQPKCGFTVQLIDLLKKIVIHLFLPAIVLLKVRHFHNKLLGNSYKNLLKSPMK